MAFNAKTVLTELVLLHGETKQGQQVLMDCIFRVIDMAGEQDDLYGPDIVDTLSDTLLGKNDKYGPHGQGWPEPAKPAGPQPRTPRSEGTNAAE